jgi:hypothetical protein
MIALILLLLTNGLAWAVPVQWTLEDVTFAEELYDGFVGTGEFIYGGAATGSFVYDADTNTYSDIAITTEAGTNLWFNSRTYDGEGTSWIYPPIDGASSDGLLLTEESGLLAAGDRTLILAFSSSLTNAGGTIALATYPESSERFDAGAFLSYRQIVSGSVSSSVVPLPAAVWLFGSALVGLGYLRRFKAAP